MIKFFIKDTEMIEWVISVLKSTPSRWLSLAEFLPAELSRQKPLPSEWSTVECLQHLVDTERVFTLRVEAFMAGKDFAAFNPDTQGSQPGERTLAELAGEFAHSREANLEQLARLHLQDLERKVRHQELGMVSLNEMLHEWAAHDLNHTIQAERALMQPFIRSSGPWQPSFSDHIVKPKT